MPIAGSCGSQRYLHEGVGLSQRVRAGFVRIPLGVFGYHDQSFVCCWGGQPIECCSHMRAMLFSPSIPPNYPSTRVRMGSVMDYGCCSVPSALDLHHHPHRKHIAGRTACQARSLQARFVAVTLPNPSSRMTIGLHPLLAHCHDDGLQTSMNMQPRCCNQHGAFTIETDNTVR